MAADKIAAKPPEFLSHHFDTAEQQSESAQLGMWVFLLTEIMFFGGLFLAYTVYRVLYPQAFAAGSDHLNVVLGGVNATVLIASSLTMALAVHAAQVGRRRLQIVVFLLATTFLGAAFLGIKVYEYSKKFEEGLIPGRFFNYTALAVQSSPAHESLSTMTAPVPGSEPGVFSQTVSGDEERRVELFFTLYYVMTGTHTLHMLIGMGILAVLAILAASGRFSKEYYTPLENVGLYWHFVDIVWIFLFPLLYLLGRHA